MSQKNSACGSACQAFGAIDGVLGQALFTGLPALEVERLLAEASLKHFGNGEVLFRQNDPASHFFILLSGYVDLFVEMPDGRQGMVDIIKPGDVFAESVMFDLQRHSVSAKALEAVTVMAIPSLSFREYLETRFDLVLLMLGSMSINLRKLIHQITELKLKTTAQRLGGFLLTLVGEQKGRVQVHLPYDKKLVAEKLGMKPESLSRALVKLRKIGVTSESDNSAVIGDVGRLRRFCLEEDND